jgi:hypothetical protein
MPALANVALTDTFDTWRIRTNQIIIKTNDDQFATIAAFDKANSANVLAYNTGIGANTYLLATISGANTAVGNGANAYSNLITTDANTHLKSVIMGANTAVGTGANLFSIATISGANTYLLATIAGANTAVGTGANTYLLATISGANTVIGTGANTYLLATIAGANTAVGTGANTYLLATIAGANTITTAAFTKANSALANTSGVTFAGNMTITGNLTALSYNTSSDERLKYVINTAPTGIDSLSAIQYEMLSDRGRLRYGFIAQEVQNVFPSLVSSDSNGMLVLNYIDIIALLLQDYKQTKQELFKIKEQLQKIITNV